MVRDMVRDKGHEAETGDKVEFQCLRGFQRTTSIAVQRKARANGLVSSASLSSPCSIRVAADSPISLILMR